MAKNQLAMRAHFICSNPDCRATTVASSEADESKLIYTGRAAHIHSAAVRGPRPNPSLTPEERSSMGNGVFLCSICADMVDDNNGLDYPAETLRAWKAQHDEWVGSNLNKRIDREPATGVHFNSTVSSSQQSGGITANVVNNNYGSAPWRLDDSMRRDLVPLLADRSQPVSVVAEMGNEQSMLLADEIALYLQLVGVTAQLSQGRGRIVRGVQVNPGGREVRVGIRE